jgi:hypothetical protein
MDPFSFPGKYPGNAVKQTPVLLSSLFQKAVLLHAMEAHGERGDIAPTHTRCGF